MARLIDADALKKVIYFETNHLGIDFHKSKLIGIAIDNAPTIDAEPIRYGEWIGKPMIGGYSRMRCSVCDNVFLDNKGKWNYCPHCGARMDEEEAK